MPAYAHAGFDETRDFVNTWENAICTLDHNLLGICVYLSTGILYVCCTKYFVESTEYNIRTEYFLERKVDSMYSMRAHHLAHCR